MSELSDLMYTLTGKAMELHDKLGCDHQEHVYHRMLFSRLRECFLSKSGKLGE